MAHERLNQIEFEDFVRGADVWAKWDAARRLMAAKLMQAVAADPDFRISFRALGNIAINGRETEQLLAIALVVRISELVKGDLRKDASEILAESLRRPIDGMWNISETKKLPLESKPSEIRENIALALSHATGSWIVPYVVEALAREEKSHRCRLELVRQLSKRDQAVSRWLSLLRRLSWSDFWVSEKPDRFGRLREIAIALTTALREKRTYSVIVDDESGPELAQLMQEIVSVVRPATRGPNVINAAISTIELLEVFLASDFTLIVDPEAYAPVGVIAKWWQSTSYPSAVSESLEGIVSKLISAIRLRARLGQRSEGLVVRLRQACGSVAAAAHALAHVAETESGLAPEIDDWLRGKKREDSITADAVASLLSEAATPALADALAPMLLDSIEAESVVVRNEDSPLAAHLRRICGRIQSLASELNLRTIGTIGEIVEFNPTAYRTVSGAFPPEPQVRLRRPMVVREREDGSRDVVERGIVDES